VSNALSSILYLFLAPAGKLYLKVQQLLVHGEAHDTAHPSIVGKRRPGPKHPKYAVPAEHCPMIIYRVEDNNESLRQVADEYRVSHETIRRIMFHAQKQRGQLDAQLCSDCHTTEALCALGLISTQTA
jgi:hypothetical protein